ncbi:MAG TPA: hypothetical protein ENN69_02165 [Spirochaetia bacterium]|nr:hypothetical protein [Spirochaetia bacterium]
MGIKQWVTERRRERRLKWEALCKRCGVCCFGKESRFFRTIIHMEEPCEFFDRKTRLCTVYDQRFRACRFCGKVRLYHALFSRSLPETCGYVEHYRRYRFIKTAEIKPERISQKPWWNEEKTSEPHAG